MENYDSDTLPINVQHFLDQQRKQKIDETLRVQESIATRMEELLRDTEAGQNYGFYNFSR